MRPRTLKQKLFLTVSILVIASGVSISQLVTHRYSTSLIQGAVAQTENIAHNLALDAVDKILINDLVALQKLLAKRLGVPPSSVEILSGHTSRQKRVRVTGITATAVRALMDKE